MKKKKTYRMPFIEMVKIDRELVLLSTSEGSGPTLPEDPEPLSTGHPNSSNLNKFKDNPFEK